MADSLSVSQVKPLPGYLLVEPASSQKQTASGIYLPDSHEEKPQHGTVLAVGAATTVDGVKVECPVKVKDAVVYKKWGGNDLKIGDVEYQILKFEDVLAVVK
jgi:chaperonin GroES